MLQTYRMRAFGCLLCLILFAGSFASGQEAPTLRAGAAIANITPPLGELVVGGFVPFPANQIHDPLHARCLVLDDGKTRIAIVICDNLGINRDVYDRSKKADFREFQNPSQPNPNGSHTHAFCDTGSRNQNTGRPLSQELQQLLMMRSKNLTPAKIRLGRH